MFKTMKTCLALFLSVLTLCLIAPTTLMADELGVNINALVLSATVSLSSDITINPNDTSGDESGVISSTDLSVTNNSSVPIEVTVSDVSSAYNNIFVEYSTNTVSQNIIDWRTLGHTNTLKYIALSVDNKDVLPDTEVSLGVLPCVYDEDNASTYVVDAKTGYAWKSTDVLNRVYPMTILLAIKGDEVAEDEIEEEPETVQSFMFEVNATGGAALALKMTPSVAGVTINWGDGVVEEVLSSNPSHTYAVSGLNTIEILGDVTNMSFQNNTKITKVLSPLPYINNTSFKSMFSGCSQLNEVCADIFSNNTQVTTFEAVFQNCIGLRNIPEEIFSYTPNVTSFSSAFSGDTGLVSVPEGLFNSNVAVKSFYYIFSGCSELKNVPENLFSANVNVTSFGHTFSYTALQSIPENLFKNNTKVESFASTFSGSKLTYTTIPADLFKNTTRVTSFASTFATNPSLTTLPAGLFRTQVANPSFSETFYLCTSLTDISEDLFKGCSSVTIFSSTFAGCSKLTSIPVGLFRENTEVIKFVYTFGDCTALTSIPVGLFKENTKVINFARTFQSCKALKSIPSELFATNVLTTDFESTFYDCSELEVIPENLFVNNTKARYFKDTFGICTKLKVLPETLFNTGGSYLKFEGMFRGCTSLISIPSNLMPKAVSCFTRTFDGCANLTGEAPLLWEIPGQAEQNVWGEYGYDDCFSGCTKLTNYEDIPEFWK